VTRRACNLSVAWLGVKAGAHAADTQGMSTLEAITSAADTLDTAMSWAHDQGDYTVREFANGSAYRCELVMMRDSWADRYPNVAGALALLASQPMLDTSGLTDPQLNLLLPHRSDSAGVQAIMADQLRKTNRMQLGLAPGCGIDELDQAMRASGAISE
jgi:hypothetical protein